MLGQSRVILCVIFVSQVVTYGVMFLFSVLCCHLVDVVFCAPNGIVLVVSVFSFQFHMNHQSFLNTILQLYTTYTYKYTTTEKLINTHQKEQTAIKLN